MSEILKYIHASHGDCKFLIKLTFSLLLTVLRTYQFLPVGEAHHLRGGSRFITPEVKVGGGGRGRVKFCSNVRKGSSFFNKFLSGIASE